MDCRSLLIHVIFLWTALDLVVNCEPPSPISQEVVKCLLKTGPKAYVVWEDPDGGELLYVTNGEGEIGCCDDECPQRPTVGNRDRTHDAEQHFILYLKLTKQLERKNWVKDIWLNYSPCAACADTIINYYQNHGNMYGNWRPNIHVARIYRQDEAKYQQLHREGLKKLFDARFHLEALDPKKFLAKYKSKLSKPMQDVLREKEVHKKTKACLYAVKYNCHHPDCGKFGTDNHLHECDEHDEL